MQYGARQTNISQPPEGNAAVYKPIRALALRAFGKGRVYFHKREGPATRAEPFLSINLLEPRQDTVPTEKTLTKNKEDCVVLPTMLTEHVSNSPGLSCISNISLHKYLIKRPIHLVSEAREVNLPIGRRGL